MRPRPRMSRTTLSSFRRLRNYGNLPLPRSRSNPEVASCVDFSNRHRQLQMDWIAILLPLAACITAEPLRRPVLDCNVPDRVLLRPAPLQACVVPWLTVVGKQNRCPKAGSQPYPLRSEFHPDVRPPDGFRRLPER